MELKARFPQSKRVHGVEGIRKAHEKAAELSTTDFFFVVDGDNRITNGFNFELKDIQPKEDTLYVWRCRNPINNLVYGFGAIKLYNKKLLKKRNDNYLDLATTVSEMYHIVHEVASETLFFGTPEEAWRGAFRECAKLSSKMIEGQKNGETEERLNIWCTVSNDLENAEWCLKGAKAGIDFGQQIKQKPSLVSNINNYKWLHDEFRKYL